MLGRGGTGPAGTLTPSWTRGELADGLAGLGLTPGEDVLVHCSLRGIGWLEDGPRTLLEALRDLIGPTSTVVVPTYTADNSRSSPSHRRSTAGMTSRQLAVFLDAAPGFDPAATPSQSMGAFAEHVRTRPGACRSAHPQTSFAALGPSAADITRMHPLDCHLGKDSPLGRLYARAGRTVLLGVGFDRATAFHLAEYSLGRPRRPYYAKIAKRRSRAAWVRFDDIELDDSGFGALGETMRNEPWLRSGVVGAADCFSFPIRPAVDLAIDRLRAETHVCRHRDTKVGVGFDFSGVSRAQQYDVPRLRPL